MCHSNPVSEIRVPHMSSSIPHIYRSSFQLLKHLFILARRYRYVSCTCKHAFIEY